LLGPQRGKYWYFRVGGAAVMNAELVASAAAVCTALCGSTWLLASRISRLDVHLAELRVLVASFESRIARLERLHDDTRQ